MERVNSSGPPYDPKYSTFISYKRGGVDEEVASLLVEIIERYRTPASLIRAERTRAVPPRLARAFRDREESRAGGQLSELLWEALRDSPYLILVASPRSRDSRYVQEEVETFVDLHSRARVIVLLIAGDRRTSIPETLEGTLYLDCRGCHEDDSRRRREVLKAVHSHRLRFLATLLGCDFDDLQRRDFKRQIRRVRIILGVAIVSSVVLLGLSAWAILERARAIRSTQRAEHALHLTLTTLEGFTYQVAPKLRDLPGGDELEEEIGGVLQTLTAYLRQEMPEEAMVLRAELGNRNARIHAAVARGDLASARNELDLAMDVSERLLAMAPNSVLFLSDRVILLRQRGKILLNEGDYEGALELYERSRSFLERQLAVESDELKKVVSLAKHARAVGNVLLAARRYGVAEEEFGQGLRSIAEVDELDRTASIDVLESSLLVGRSQCRRFLGSLAAASSDLERVMVLLPESSWRNLSVADTRLVARALSSLGSQLSATGDLEGSIRWRRKSRQLLEWLAESQPTDRTVRSSLAAITAELGDALCACGREDECFEMLSSAIEHYSSLVSDVPSDEGSRVRLVSLLMARASAEFERDPAAVESTVEEIGRHLELLTEGSERASLEMRALALGGTLLTGQGKVRAGVLELQEALRQWTTFTPEPSDERYHQNFGVDLAIRVAVAHKHNGDDALARRALKAAFDRLASHPTLEPPPVEHRWNIVYLNLLLHEGSAGAEDADRGAYLDQIRAHYGWLDERGLVDEGDEQHRFVRAYLAKYQRR